VIRTLQRQLPLQTLALATALLLFAGQTLAAQHLHFDAPEPGCVVCATGHHDHPPPVQAVAPLDPVAVDDTPAPVFQPATLSAARTHALARAPPAP